MFKTIIIFIYLTKIFTILNTFRPTIQTTLLGRLGNQLFTYAASRVMALENNCNLELTEEWVHNHGFTCRLDCFNLPDVVTVVPTKHFSIKQKIGYFIYMLMCRHKTIDKVHEIERTHQRLFHRFGLILNQEGYIKPLKLDGGNWYALGYFQSDKYFSMQEELIRKELTFREDRLCADAKVLGQEIKSKNSVCMHIRMGDYIKDPVFGVCSLDYYYRALKQMKHLNPEAEIYVFSDNIDLVKEAMKDVRDIEFHYIDAKYNDQESMFLGSCCRHFIMSNSTFSWWMQYLSDNKNKIVLAPNRWYNTNNPCDIYQDSWRLVEI